MVSDRRRVSNSSAVNNPVPAGTTKPRGSNDTIREVRSAPELLNILEREIVELTDKLNIKLLFFTTEIFDDLAKFIEILKVSPGDKVVLVMSSDDSLLLHNITEILTSEGAVVHSYVSNRLPSGVFAIGIAKKAV